MALMPIKIEVNGRYHTALDAQEAAEYLETSLANLNHHSYVSERLTAHKVGNKRYYLQSDLEKFKALDISPGPSPKRRKVKKNAQ